MRRGHWLVPLFLGSLLILWSSYVSAMIRLGVVQEFGATMKRQCAAFNAAHSSMDYRRMRTFYDQCGNLDTNAYLTNRHEYLKHQIFKPIPRLSFTAASLYDLDVATLPPPSVRQNWPVPK